MGYEVFESRGLGGTNRQLLVEEIKRKAGELDDLIVKIAEDEEIDGGEIGINDAPRPQQCHRLTALARTQLEITVMWAIKAVSRG